MASRSRMSTAEGLRRENAMTFQPPREHEVVEIATSGRGRGDAGHMWPARVQRTGNKRAILVQNDGFCILIVENTVTRPHRGATH